VHSCQTKKIRENQSNPCNQCSN